MYAFFRNIPNDILVTPRGTTVDFTRKETRMTMDVIQDVNGLELVFTINGLTTWRNLVLPGENLVNKINNLVTEKFNLMAVKGF